MADYKNVGLDPVGAPHAYEKQEVGKPSRNAAQPCAVYDPVCLMNLLTYLLYSELEGEE